MKDERVDYYDLVAEFIRCVGAMRAAQRDYFKTRSRDALVLSKDLELKVDNLFYTLQNPDPFIVDK